MSDPVTDRAGAPSVPAAAMRGLCPRCGAATLFAGRARFAERCRACGLDFAQFDVGDGPAAFLTLILGAVVTGLATWLQVAVGPPFWVHILLWVPLTIAGVFVSLRLAKGALMALEYAQAVREGRS